MERNLADASEIKVLPVHLPTLTVDGDKFPAFGTAGNIDFQPFTIGEGITTQQILRIAVGVGIHEAKLVDGEARSVGTVCAYGRTGT